MTALRLATGLLFAILFALPSQAAITFFGSAASPANTAQNSTPPISITPPSGMRAGQLVYVVVVLRDGTAPVSITNTGGQAWTTEQRLANGSSSSISIFWCIFDGAWDANPTFATNLSFSAAFGAFMSVFSPSSGSGFARDQNVTTGSVATPATPFDITATGQTPTSASSVSIFSWEVAQLKTFELRTTGAGFNNPSNITQSQWNNAASSAAATLSLAYKIQTSAAPTGNVTKRITNGDQFSATRWTAETFKEVPATVSSIKFHPGHYVWKHCGWDWRVASTLTCLKQMIDEIQSEPQIEGILVRQWWAALEGPDMWDYSTGIAKMTELVDYAADRGKRVALNVHPIQFGGFGTLSDIFPAYIVNEAQFGTTQFNIPNAGNGVTARVWQTPTNQRLIELARAYGAAFDSNPHVEWYEPGGETSINVIRNTDGYTPETLTARIQELFTAARAAWPTTGVRLHANFLQTDALMQAVLDTCASAACMIGGPDTLPNQSIQANRLYRGQGSGDDYRNVMPFVSEVQTPELCGKEGTFTPAQLYSWAWTGGTATQSDGTVINVPPVDPSYFVWYRNMETCPADSPQRWIPTNANVKGIKAFIVGPPTPTPALRTDCPSSYATGGGCNSN